MFVLTGCEAWIIGTRHNECSAHSTVGCGEQGVGCHIEAHMLHGDQCAASGKCDSKGDFRGDFFVWRPFSGDAVRTECREDFGGGRSGVSRAACDVVMSGCESDGFVATQEYSKGVLHRPDS